jgi:tRNA1Val (adenine37-N6)-methyltransferase
VLGPLTDDRLTRDVWLYQREKGHRFSVDDLATAYVAFHAAPTARRVLDLGCGLGTVLLHLAWSLPEARLWGIEAQEVSFELLARNVERNGARGRVTIAKGDLRDERDLAPLGGDFELITGTPPYFPADAALPAEDEQRAFARLERRGGIEAYVTTGARLLAASGVLVLCGDGRATPRLEASARAAGLGVQAQCDVIARSGRPALFSVWTLGREPRPRVTSSLVMRDERGERTEDAARLKAFSGLGGGAQPYLPVSFPTSST